LLKEPLALYRFERSSKLTDTSLGKVFFGAISFFKGGEGFGETAAAAGFGATAAARGFGEGVTFCGAATGAGLVGTTGGWVATAGFS
jgi:hypothetical protein